MSMAMGYQIKGGRRHYSSQPKSTTLTENKEPPSKGSIEFHRTSYTIIPNLLYAHRPMNGHGFKLSSTKSNGPRASSGRLPKVDATVQNQDPVQVDGFVWNQDPISRDGARVITDNQD